MMYTYFNTVTSGTTPAPTLGDGTRSIVVRKIIIGNPVSGATFTLFNIFNALSNNTTQIAFNLTLPTFSTTNTNAVFPIVIDFRASSGVGGGSIEEDGLNFQSGGSVALSTTLQVTILWDYAEGN